MLAVIGQAGTLDLSLTQSAEQLGRLAIDAGFRVATGGLDGVMAAVSRGARSAERWRDGDVIGVLPSYERSTANAWVDIAIPTGLGIARNVVLVAMADVVIVVGGRAGTLGEMAHAWQLGKPVIALAPSGGWAARLAGQAIDDRVRAPVVSAASPEEAIAAAHEAIVGT